MLHRNSKEEVITLGELCIALGAQCVEVYDKAGAKIAEYPNKEEAMHKMSEKEVNVYMQSILTGKKKIDHPLESRALDNLRQITNELTQGQQKLGQLASETEKLRQHLQRLNGRQEAYATVLIAAEESRRNELKDKCHEIEKVRDKITRLAQEEAPSQATASAD